MFTCIFNNVGYQLIHDLNINTYSNEYNILNSPDIYIKKVE